MSGLAQMMAPHPLDNVFAHSGEGTAAVVQALVNNPSFVAAVQVGIAAELDQQASEAGHRPHPGPGEGQSGRAQFLENLREGNGGGSGCATPA